MTVHTRQETVDFAAGYMRSNPTTGYAEIKSAGRRAGFNIYPLIIGLAKKQIGKPGPARATRRRHAHPTRRLGVKNGTVVMRDLVRGVERMSTESAQMRDALRQIGKLAAALA